MWQKMSVLESESVEDTPGSQPPAGSQGAGHGDGGRVRICPSYGKL